MSELWEKKEGSYDALKLISLARYASGTREKLCGKTLICRMVMNK